MPRLHPTLLSAILLTACGAKEPQAICAAHSLDLLTFNIEYGGDLVDFGKVVAAIRASGASIVAIEEGYGHTDRLADSLGWNFDRRTQVLSRGHLVAMQGAAGTAISLIETSPGCAVAVANVHLPSDPTVDTLITQGKMELALDIEHSVRLPPLELVLKDLSALAVSGIPVFLAGDFNAGSHLDGTIQWPTSLAVERAGFSDSYRATHPDPAAQPGFTWWAGRPPVQGWNPAPTDLQQRIDYIFATGAVRPLQSRILGEAGGRDVDLPFDPWVSDHRALLSSFELTPAPFPPLVAVAHQRAIAGDSISVEVVNHAAGASVVIFPADADGPTGGRAERRASVTAGLDTLQFGSADLAPGGYDVVLLSKGLEAIARARFWIGAPGARPTISVDSTPLVTGQPITVRWADIPGNRWDWVGMYLMNAQPDSSNPLVWQHTGATRNGSATLNESSEGSTWPLPAGDYRVILGLDDSYLAIAEARVHISDAP